MIDIETVSIVRALDISPVSLIWGFLSILEFFPYILDIRSRIS
jgi:hypothetical protein